MKRFWNKVDKAGKGGCWLWISALDKDGYGLFKLGRTMTRVHRLSLFWALGEFPAEKPLAIHSCRSRNCVNPKHLRWGSNKENMADKIKDGTALFGDANPSRQNPKRLLRGEECSWCKFSDVEVRKIFKAKGSYKEIANQFGCSIMYVSLVKRKKMRKEATVKL